MKRKRWLSSRPRLSLAVLAAMLALSAASACPAQTSDTAIASPKADATTHRRVFVPADRPEEWPTLQQRYLPLDREEFERLAAAAEATRQLSVPGAVHIASATYRASLAADASLSGVVAFDVKAVDEGPRVLRLWPTNVAMSDARWLSVKDGEEEALVGVWLRPGEESSRFGVLAPKSDTLELKWAAPPQSASSTELEYALELPVAVSQQLMLDLPAGHTTSMTPARLVTKEPSPGASTTRWTFQLGAATAYRLVIRRPAGEDPQPSSSPLVAISEDYELAPQGLDYEAELRIQRRDKHTSDLRIILPTSLRVTEVLVDRTPVAWQRDEKQDDALAVALPPSSGRASITIKAAAPVALEAPWELPRAAPLECFWTEGTTTIWVDPALELQSIVPRGATLLNIVGAGQAERGEAYRVQAWSAEARTEVIIAKQSAELRSTSGISAEFADRELVGRCRARLWATKGRIFQVTAEVESDWTVESVIAEPPDALGQWHLADDGRQRRLHLQLRRSPTENQPLYLTVTGRRPLRGWTRAARLGELKWIHMPGGDAADGLLLVKDRRGGQLSPDAQAVAALVDADSLTSQQRSLFENPRDGLLVATGKMDRTATLRVGSTAARFEGEAWIELVRRETGFEHHAEILCRPTLGVVSELVVKTARALPADARWTLVDSGEQPIVQAIRLGAMRRGGAARASAASAEGGAYRVRFAQPRGASFRLRVSWRGEDSTSDSINGMVLDGAEAWQAWGILRGNPHESRFDPNGCASAAVVPDMPEDERSPEVIGCYRLGDDPSALDATPSLTVVQANAKDADRRIVSSMLEMTTLQFADGNQTHQLSYHLTANGGDAVELTIPNGLSITSARVNNRPAAIDVSDEAPNRATIQLPKSQRLAALTIDLHAQVAPLGFRAKISPPIVGTTFPIMRGTWTVLSPPGYEEAGAFDAAKPGVLQRLFGPLARGSANGAHRIGVRAAYGAGDVPATLAGGEQRRSTSTAAAPSGWRPATQEFITEPMPIRLRLIDGVDATWYVVGLVSAVAAAWLWPRRRRWVTIAAMIAAICCLTLSAASIVAAQAVFLGILAGVFARRVAAATPTASRAELRTPAAAGVGLAIMLAAGGLGAEAAETRPVPPSVLYPIDADGKAVGSDVYVPEALVSKLLPSARAARYDGATAALLGAQYEINLSKDQPGGGQVCEKCTLRYRWRTFQPGARIELPLVRGEAAWLAENHTLNGKKVQLTWSASGRGCSLRLDQPGEHELKLELTPRRRTLGDRGQLRLHVLPLPGAIVEINHPAGVEELEIGGAAPLAAGTTRTTARIPGVDVLEASWPIRVRGEAARVSLDQLTWLDVDPATSRLEVRLRLTGDSASVDRLELAVSPQLKLLPLPEDSPIQHLPTAADSPATVELKFRSPPQLPLVLSLPFELQRSVSVGRIDYPSVRVLNAETNSHHFAVSAGSRLRVRDEGASGMTPVTTKEIDQTWGAGPAAAVLQYAMTTAEPTWSLNVERMPDRFAARESLELLCTAADAHVAYAAAIDDVEGEVLVHRLGIPTQLKIKDVSVTGESPTERTPIRWSRPRPDQLWMFLGRPLSQSHTIHISARADYAGDRRLAIPRIGLATSGASTTAVRIRRSSDVLVEWPEGAEPPAGAAPPIATEDVDGLLVGQYSISRRAAPELKVRSNEPRFSADAVLTMDLARVEPVAACVVQGQVTRGVVDGVRLLTDTAWTGPFTVASGGDVEINKAAEAGRQMIEVRLAKPAVAGETFVLRLTGPIALQNDQRIRFPTLHLVDALDERLFLVLPRHAGNQAPQWTLQGLRRAELPEPLSQALGQSSRGSVYRVERERFVAEQRVFPAGILRAQVRLAEIRVTVDRGGLWSAVAQLIVQPGGASPLSVRPPAGAALVHAEVDGRPVIDSSPSDDGWELPAGSRYLPRVVTVGYRSRDGKGDRDLFVATPHIMADGRRLPVSKSLWQIEADGPLSLEATGAARPLSRFEFQSAARRNQIAAVVDASPLAFQLHPWELHQWFEPWLARLGPAADSAAVAEDSQEAAWNQLRERLTDLTATRFTPQTSASPGERRAQDLAVTARFYEGRGDGIALTARPGSDAARWLAALALAVVTGLAWRYPTKLEPLLSAARRRPYAVGAMAGVYWWFALSPSLLGPVIIAASIVGFYKHRQESEPRRHNEHDENNTAVGSS